MTHHPIWILILAAAMLTGCERENSTSPSAGNSVAAQRAAADAAAKAAADAKAANDLKAAADARIAADVKAAADAKAAANAKIAADVKAAAAAKAAADAKIAADLKAAANAKTAAGAAAKAAADDTTAKATSLLAQLQQHVKDNKVELAAATLTELDGMKGSLPASLQERIESARTALNVQKAAAVLR